MKYCLDLKTFYIKFYMSNKKAILALYLRQKKILEQDKLLKYYKKNKELEGTTNKNNINEKIDKQIQEINFNQKKLVESESECETSDEEN